MTVSVANLTQATATFQAWFNKTNETAYVISQYSMTANSTLGEATGNSRLYGIFSSNTLVAEDGLRGGNNTASAVLTITSNLEVDGTTTLANTLDVAGLSTFTAGIDTTSANISSDINVANIITINSSIITMGNSSVNTEITEHGLTVGTTIVNSSVIEIGGTAVNSTTLGLTTNNATYLAGKTWESPKEIGGVAANAATFTTITAEKLTANGSLGSAGEILKANSSGGLFWSTGGEGYTGSAGSSGTNGYTGSAVVGYTGSTGAAASQGYTGSAGAEGTPGAEGYTGSVGNDGTPGGSGYTGSRGYSGSVGTGYTGSIGGLGYTGSSGNALNGFTGSRGDQGTTGFTGSKGDQGNIGYYGSKGFTGSAGSSGTNGFTGSRGFTGSWGGVAGGSVNMNNFNIGNTNSLGVGTSSSGSSGEIRATGNITAYYSDERLKKILGYIDNALSKVQNMSGFYYEPNEIAISLGYTQGTRDVGLSAQDVQLVLPEAVTEAPISDEYLAIRYEKLIPLLVEAIKELAERVDAIQ